MKVYLAHDYLNQWGGGERVMEIFHQIYPDSSIKTITYDPQKLPHLKKYKIETSFIQKLPFGIKKYKWYLILMPLAVEKLKFPNADLVLSDSSGFIKGINVPQKALHICYIHTSTRYLTVDTDYFQYTTPSFLHPFLPFILKKLQKIDYLQSQKPDVYIANSKTTAERIRKYYHRDVDEIVFPPVDTTKFYRKDNDQISDYYLIAGRLMPYKKTEIAIKACNQLKKKLIVIGIGSDEDKLKSIAGPTIQFRGKVSDEELRDVYAGCRALIFPPLEDAGMIPLETMACGRPVIAFGKGGALESVEDGKTGIFFDKQTPDSVIEAINIFEKMKFDSKYIQKHADEFSAERFKNKIKKIIDNKYILFQQGKLKKN